MEEIVFEPETIVRIKSSGLFARIKKQCTCTVSGDRIHYEAWIEERIGVWILFHDEIELECLPVK